jgi:hypothetical protein
MVFKTKYGLGEEVFFFDREEDLKTCKCCLCVFYVQSVKKSKIHRITINASVLEATYKPTYILEGTSVAFFAESLFSSEYDAKKALKSHEVEGKYCCNCYSHIKMLKEVERG